MVVCTSRLPTGSLYAGDGVVIQQVTNFASRMAYSDQSRNFLPSARGVPFIRLHRLQHTVALPTVVVRLRKHHVVRSSRI